MVSLAAILLVSFILLVLLMTAVRRWRRATHGRRRNELDAFDSRICICGYDLSKLDRARCPECGRVRFFNATPEELGLSDDELKRLTEAQSRRDAEKRSQLASELKE